MRQPYQGCLLAYRHDENCVAKPSTHIHMIAGLTPATNIDGRKRIFLIDMHRGDFYELCYNITFWSAL